jgi:hypothetical protein
MFKHTLGGLEGVHALLQFGARGRSGWQGSEVLGSSLQVCAYVHKLLLQG